MNYDDYEPTHSYPYSVVYDSDRELDGHVPTHKAGDQ